MFKNSYDFISKPANWPFLFTLLTALTVGILSLSNQVSFEFVAGLILIVLSLISWFLLTFNNSIIKLHDRVDSTKISDLFYSFGNLEAELHTVIREADEIWLLSRTGRGWWKRFKEEFLSKKNCVNFLFLDPRNCALEMALKSSKVEWEDNPYIIVKQNCVKFLNHLSEKYENENFKIKVIDHLPAWTLLIINPNKKNRHSLIYAELATYRAPSRERPVFKINFQDIDCFEFFLKEFRIMWREAKEWNEVKINK